MQPQWVTRRGFLRRSAATAAGLTATALLAACATATTTAVTQTQVSITTKGTVSAAAKATSSAAKTASASTHTGGAKPTPTPQAGETRKGAGTTVELWLNWSGDIFAAMRALTPKIADALTGFNVSWLTASHNSTKLPVAIAAGTPPDAAAGGMPYPEYWARGFATPVDDLLAKSKAIVKSDIPEPAWNYATFKGKTYGVPAIEAFCRYGLLLDMTNLQKVGVDAKTFSWDWDTIALLQQQATQKSGSGAIQVLGMDPLSEDGVGNLSDGLWNAQPGGVSYFDESSGTYHFANEQLAETMLAVKKLYDLAGGPGPIAAWRKQYPQWVGNSKNAIPAGVQDMSIIGYYAPGQVAHLAPDRSFAFTWTPVPAAKKGYKIQSVGDHNLLIPAGSKHAPEAFQLIEFLVGDTAEQVFFNSSGFLGARLSFLKKVDTSKYPGLDFYFNSVKEADKVSGPVPDPIQSFAAAQWHTAMQDVLTGKAQPQAALQQAQQQVTTEFRQRFPNG